MTAHIETLLPAAIRAAFPGVRVVTELPADLADVTPCVRVAGIGGTADQHRFASARVDIDAYDVEHDGMSARENARNLAQQIHDWAIEDLPGQIIAGVSVLSVSDVMAPKWTPHDNTTLRRFTLTIGLRLHDRSVA